MGSVDRKWMCAGSGCVVCGWVMDAWCGDGYGWMASVWIGDGCVVGGWKGSVWIVDGYVVSGWVVCG